MKTPSGCDKTAADSTPTSLAAAPVYEPAVASSSSWSSSVVIKRQPFRTTKGTGSSIENGPDGSSYWVSFLDNWVFSGWICVKTNEARLCAVCAHLQRSRVVPNGVLVLVGGGISVRRQ